MKFNCTPKNFKLIWHDWFAWRPVRVADNDCRWLETIARRGNIEYTYEGTRYWNYEYKAKNK